MLTRRQVLQTTVVTGCVACAVLASNRVFAAGHRMLRYLPVSMTPGIPYGLSALNGKR